ncbi:diacylglycerol kinase [Roseateles sp. DAIF2]|uniref:diacylglycerol/lipid kinase family protein n=1 Tax=Roseateles sp. DAIF2 TaxID=2714952 RepID=UPI0018A25DC4|nr:diacylglycerol kinase family protein [Roseateles sp. DAIF2]QPF73929.1 diacylglycerol kinase [Roseateles sp. DAIF2]
MSCEPLIVVFNPASGHGDAEAARAAIEAACRAAGRPLVLLPVETPQRLQALAREAVRCAQEEAGVVVAAGGDGTINAVAAACLGSGRPFGVLPQGTFNYFGRSHGIPADTAEAMRLLLQERPRPVQVGLVNERPFLVNASLGLYPQLLQERESWKRQLGRSRLVAFGAALATLLRGHRNLRLRLELDGQARELRTPTLFVGNNSLQLEQLGLAEARAVERGGALAGIALRPLSRWGLLGLLGRAALGRLGEAQAVQDFSFGELTVQRALPFGARRIKVATDGEIAWLSLPLRFRVAPEPLLLIRPADDAKATP